jgi:environmental stress-induced protein Ves
MKFKILKEFNFRTTKWSGGDTTQLYIYPQEGNYVKKDFMFRLSTATVTDKKSAFTKLSGVSRKLMVLSGEMKLEHKGRYSKVLKEFDQDSFMGDWDTVSYGKVVDFNLMTKDGCRGKLENVKVMPNSKITLELISSKSNKVLKALYPVGQPMELLLGEEEIAVAEKNLVIIEQDKGDEGNTIGISNKSKDGILNIIMVEVMYD